jgi:hypothetical protein
VSARPDDEQVARAGGLHEDPRGHALDGLVLDLDAVDLGRQLGRALEYLLHARAILTPAPAVSD